ncbi:hypothetical protein AX15_006889 [Amanita polypyramis BW_CC]|nr:hypothetical protein AX15_006889 [Amanita polypyramis BW_CC]
MSNIIVNPAPICHKIPTDLVAEPEKSDNKVAELEKSDNKGKGKDTTQMDTSEDFIGEKDMSSSNITYHTAPLTLSPKIEKFTKGIECGTIKGGLSTSEARLSHSHTPL